MNVREAVLNRENYATIAAYYQDLSEISTEQASEMLDVIEAMSPQIYEYYRSVCDCFRKIIRKKISCFPRMEGTERKIWENLIERACRMDLLLAEKYEEYYGGPR